MAFCRYCGTQLEDGAVCPCRQNAAQSEEQNASTDFAAAPVQAPAAQGSDFVAKVLDAVKAAANEFVPSLKRYVKEPKATVHDAVVRGKLSVTGGYFVLNALVLIIAVCGLISSVASLLGAFGALLGIKVDLPVFRMILSGIVISGVGMVLASTALFVFAKIGKSRLTYKGAAIAAALHSLWPTAIMLGGAIFGFIGGGFGITVSLLAFLFAFLMIFVTASSDARSLGGCDVTATTGKMFLSTLAVFGAVIVTALVAYWLLGWCINGISANGYEIGDLGSLLSGLF